MNTRLLRLLRGRRGLLKLLRERPVLGVLASVLLHVTLLATLWLVRAPHAELSVKRGEPLFVELPQLEEPAPRGNPAARVPGPEGPRVSPSPPPRAGAESKARASRPAPPVARSVPPLPPRLAAPRMESPAPTPPAPEPPRHEAPEPPRVAAAVPPPPPPPPAFEPPRAPKAPEPPPPEPDRSSVIPTPSPAPLPSAASPVPVVVQPARPSSGPQQEVRVRDAPAAPVPPPGGREPAGAGKRGDTAGATAGVPSLPDIRTALRRGGGGGGAGGLGQGRGGIEGEPIPLDSRDPKYNDYLDQVRRRIKAKWSYPCVQVPGSRDCEYKSAQLVVEFGIAKDGRVPFVTVRRESGYEIYDEFAVNAIKLASPFPPVPDSLSKMGIPILARFNYVLETSSLTNVLR